MVNFPPRQIGPFMSEVLTLGVPDENGEVMLIGSRARRADRRAPVLGKRSRFDPIDRSGLGTGDPRLTRASPKDVDGRIEPGHEGGGSRWVPGQAAMTAS